MICPYCGATDHEVVQGPGAIPIAVCPEMPKDQAFMVDSAIWRTSAGAYHSWTDALQQVLPLERLEEVEERERTSRFMKLLVSRPDRQGKVTGL